MFVPRRLSQKTEAGRTAYGEAPKEAVQPQLPTCGGGDQSESDGLGGDHAAVEGQLRDALECEVALAIASVAALGGGSRVDSGHACPLCPFRRFAQVASLVKHLERAHAHERGCVASGTKQKRLVYALYDSDVLAGRDPMDLLCRSASAMRESVVPALPPHQNAIDKLVRLVLAEDGPEYRNAAWLGSSSLVRRVGNLYYTRGFANLLFREIMMAKGRLQL